jgi:hypothetical protein
VRVTADGARKKRWRTPVTAYLRTPVCTAQVACDGVNLQGPRIALGTCGACGKAAAKRGKPIPPRGGEGYEE